jgi:hypothetical protein
MFKHRRLRIERPGVIARKIAGLYDDGGIRTPR